MAKLYSSLKYFFVRYKFEFMIFIFLAYKMFKPYAAADNLVYISLRFFAAVVFIAFITWISGRIIRSSEEKRDFKFHLGSTIASSLFGLLCGVIISSIIWLNMSPLHSYPLNLFLFYFGKYNLYKQLKAITHD